MGLGKFESHSSGLGNVERIERREFVRIDIPPDFFLVFFFYKWKRRWRRFWFFSFVVSFFEREAFREQRGARSVIVAAIARVG